MIGWATGSGALVSDGPPTDHCQRDIVGVSEGQVGQAKRSRTKVLPKDAILLPEIVDEIFLVAIHPASQGQHEEVQSVGHGLSLRGSDSAVTHVVLGIHSPRRRFLAPYGVRSVKDECLAKLILVGEPAPRTALRAYVEHFHGERNH